VPRLPVARSAPPAAAAKQRTAVERQPSALPAPSLVPLLVWPVLLSVAITGLRLLGELRHWSTQYWNREAGGGLSLLGIVWLVPLVGFYLGWRLQSRGLRRGLRAPSMLQAALQGPVALAAAGGALLLLARLRHASQMSLLSWTAWLTLWALASVVAVAVAIAAWPALGRLLLAYALLVRSMVAGVMALAIHRNLGTHYDAAPPGFPYMPPLERWLWIGLLPQLTIWVAITVSAGLVCAVLGWQGAAQYARYRRRG
jgi:hypothetical protein